VTAPSAHLLYAAAFRDGRFGAFASGVTGTLDALVVHIDEDGGMGNHGPRWRVFCDPMLHDTVSCDAPQLPSSVSLADVGVQQGGNAIAMLQRAHAGSLWSSSGMPFPSAYLEWQLAPSYVPFAATTFAP
jgi:hypothetical protein